MKFKDLKIGECFSSHGGYFIKTEEKGFSGCMLMCNAVAIQGDSQDKGEYMQFMDCADINKIVFTGIHTMEDE